MRRFAAFVSVMTMFGQTAEIRNPRTSAEDVAAGAKTFRSHCAECHGLSGEGGRGPNLATGEYFHGETDSALLRNISDGIPGTEMPGLFYSADRVWQVVAYLRSLHAGSASTLKGNPQAGAAVFVSTGCAGCHRVKGSGGRVGPDLTNIGKARSPQHLRDAITKPALDVRQRYWVVNLTADDGKSASGFLMNEDTYTVQFIDARGNLHSYAKTGLKDFRIEKKVSKMPAYEGKLSGQQIDDLVAYLASLRPGNKEMR